MILLRTKIQVLAFVVIAVLGVAFVGFRYVGLGQAVFGGTYTVKADFAQSGGIFSNAEVTYRGVTVGRVGQLHLTKTGVQVDLELDRGRNIPRNTEAVVADRSAVGEQYVDLQPATDSAPYLGEGSVIPQSRTRTPLPVATLLLHLNEFVSTVDKPDLAVVIDELGKAFNNAGPDLQRLVDSGNDLIGSANDNLDQTVKLIQDGETVLATQNASADYIKRFAAALASLTTQLRSSDPDIRRLLADGAPATTQLTSLLNGLQPNLSYLLSNLITTGNITAQRLDGIQQIFVDYPLATTGGFSVIRPYKQSDGSIIYRAAFGLVNPLTATNGVCQAGYPNNDSYSGGTPRKNECTNSELASGTGQRSDRYAPRAGSTPTSSGSTGASSSGDGGPGATAANPGYDPSTGEVLGPDGTPVIPGGTGGQQRVLGDQSFQWLLLGPLAG